MIFSYFGIQGKSFLPTIKFQEKSSYLHRFSRNQPSFFYQDVIRQMEKGMAIDSSVLAWRIPGTEEPGGLPSMGSTESDTTEVT